MFTLGFVLTAFDGWSQAEAGDIRFVLIDGPGQASVCGAPDALVREVVNACCA